MSFKLIPFIVSLAMFMEAVDSTVINTAIPVMANSLQVSPIDLKIALISYLLSLAVFIPISGWLGDKFGIKRVFLIGLYVFTISSLFCGIAHNLPELVIFRILQGLGGSVMLPLGRLIVIKTYEKHELISIMSQVVMVGAIGMMLGPTLGGMITHYLSWRWIFFVNIPVGIFNIILAHRYLAEIKAESVHRLDKIGFFLFGFGLALLTLGLSALSETEISQSTIISIFISAVVLLIGYVIRSRTQANPIVNTKVFQFRTFRVATFGNLFSRLSFGGLPFLIPLLLQIGLGYSPQLSGFLLAPMAIGVVISKAVSLQILRLMGYKRFLMLNTIFIGVVLCLFSLVNQNTSLLTIIVFTFIFGYLTAHQYTGMNSLAYSEMTHALYSSATSIMGTLQQLAQSFGVAVSAILIQYFANSTSGQSLISIHSLHDTFIAMGLLTTFSILIFIGMKSDDGSELLRKPV